MEPNERMRVMLSLMGDENAPLRDHNDIAPQHMGRGREATVTSNTAAAPLAPPVALLNNDRAVAGFTPDTDMGIDEEQKEELISSYCNVTGSDPESARHLLEVRFICMYFDGSFC